LPPFFFGTRPNAKAASQMFPVLRFTSPGYSVLTLFHPRGAVPEVRMPSLKSIVPAFCFCLLVTFCAVSVKADTTYTLTGQQFTEFGEAGCPPECNLTGSFTLATPLPPNANDLAINTFTFNVGPYIFTNISNWPIGVSTNAAGVIDGWGLNLVDPLPDGEIAEIFGGPGGDQLVIGGPDGLGDGGFKFFLGADTLGTTDVAVWTVSTSTGIPEPASGTLLIAGLVGLAGLALKKSL
jgi:hypothetical protein